MPRRKLSKELKEAILLMPDKEKDKLLLRLIPSNSGLVDRLEFELLEYGETQQERREELAGEMVDQLKIAHQSFYPPPYALKDLRTFSTAINRHVFATKDKFGEISLNLLLLNTSLEVGSPRLFAGSTRKAELLRKYIVRRSLKILKLLPKLHEDLQFDLHEDFEALGERLLQHRHIGYTANLNQLNLQALADGDFANAYQ
ncbi:MAG: hypothetical protein AAF927_16255 [Bacteroidota bacterium]